MPDPFEILAVHHQKSVNSCAAAGMELLLKLHDEERPDWFDFQNRFGDTNIGFEQLALLSPYGITATDHHLAKDQLTALLTVETQAGRFPLVSLPNRGQQDFATGATCIGSYARERGWTFDLVEAVSSLDPVNRAPILAWISRPYYP
jgi:hypothetical protein